MGILGVLISLAFALLLRGIVGPQSQKDRRLHLATLGAKLCASFGTHVGTAATVAALIEGGDAAGLVAEATQRFRSVSWDILKSRSEVILRSEPLDRGRASPAGRNDLHKLTHKCALAGCDAFVSHSWRDDATV